VRLLGVLTVSPTDDAELALSYDLPPSSRNDVELALSYDLPPSSRNDSLTSRNEPIDCQSRDHDPTTTPGRWYHACNWQTFPWAHGWVVSTTVFLTHGMILLPNSHDVDTESIIGRYLS
jgi:hypothetical protein